MFSDIKYMYKKKSEDRFSVLKLLCLKIPLTKRKEKGYYITNDSEWKDFCNKQLSLFFVVVKIYVCYIIHINDVYREIYEKLIVIFMKDSSIYNMMIT